jgi:antitoxin (DNA-binding transcriptional repressor) of toxin-antitoxin stability system
MKTVDIQDTNLDACVLEAQSDRVIVTRGGDPVALVVGVQGLDAEQTQLGASDEFWKLISDRRKESTIKRSALEKKLKLKKE